MKKYVGKINSNYELIEPPLASGGEGFVYQVKDNSKVVAKVFKEDKRNTIQQKKLEVMLSGKRYTAVEEQSTWPKDLLYENDTQKGANKPIGYIMKKVENGELLCNINGPEYKTVKWIYKLAIACNLCSAVDAIHTIGHVVGDMNPRNIMINRKNTTVTLIDTDSYDVRDRQKNVEYPCCVGMGEYLAPELLKRMKNGERLDRLPLPTFTKETDNFALAIHIFSLLMDGYHPFTCRVLDTAPESTPCPQKKDSIAEGFSPYFHSKANLDIPLNAPKLTRLPLEIQNLFRKAFVDGYYVPSERPSAKVWGDTLRKLYFEKKKEEEAKKNNAGAQGSNLSSGQGSTNKGTSSTSGTANKGTSSTANKGTSSTANKGTSSTSSNTKKGSSGCGCGGCFMGLLYFILGWIILGAIIGVIVWIMSSVGLAAPMDSYEIPYSIEQSYVEEDVEDNDEIIIHGVVEEYEI